LLFGQNKNEKRRTVTMNGKEKEEGIKFNVNFEKLRRIGLLGIVPVVVQDLISRDVLGVGYANEEAIEQMLEEKILVLWSTARKKLWKVGELSGHTFHISEVRVDCAQSSLLCLVVQDEDKGYCHVHDSKGECRKSCFYRRAVDLAGISFEFV
jgi:phosphoribosyl-AMP cyclohydrolase